MSRKIVNRKELREQAEAAEQIDADQKKAGKEGKDGAKAEKPKRKSRAKKPTEVRLKAFWGVFNQGLKRVALYEYADRKQADKKAAEISASGKSPHFVKPVKEAIAVSE